MRTVLHLLGGAFDGLTLSHEDGDPTIPAGGVVGRHFIISRGGLHYVYEIDSRTESDGGADIKAKHIGTQ